MFDTPEHILAAAGVVIMAGFLVGAVLYQYMQTSTLTNELKRRGFQQGKFDFARKVNLTTYAPRCRNSAWNLEQPDMLWGPGLQWEAAGWGWFSPSKRSGEPVLPYPYCA